MSENSCEYELMVFVERIVRPVHASGKTKLRMRGELLAHLEEIYAEEAAATSNRERALKRTAERFGAPDEVRASLQETVRFPERYGYWADHLVARHAGEPRLQFALRAGVTIGLFNAVMILAGVLVMTLFQDRAPLMVLPFLTQLSAVFAIDAFIVTFVSTFVADRFLHFPSARCRNTVLLQIGSVVIAATLAGSEAALMTFAQAEAGHVVRLAIAAGSAALVLSPAILLAYIADRRKLLPWESLHLAER